MLRSEANEGCPLPLRPLSAFSVSSVFSVVRAARDHAGTDAGSGASAVGPVAIAGQSVQAAAAAVPAARIRRAAKRERASLELARTKLQNDLAASTNERHRQMIEAALQDLEKKLSN